MHDFVLVRMQTACAARRGHAGPDDSHSSAETRENRGDEMRRGADQVDAVAGRGYPFGHRRQGCHETRVHGFLTLAFDFVSGQTFQKSQPVGIAKTLTVEQPVSFESRRGEDRDRFGDPALGLPDILQHMPEFLFRRGGGRMDYCCFAFVLGS